MLYTSFRLSFFNINKCVYKIPFVQWKPGCWATFNLKIAQAVCEDRIRFLSNYRSKLLPSQSSKTAGLLCKQLSYELLNSTVINYTVGLHASMSYDKQFLKNYYIRVITRKRLPSLAQMYVGQQSGSKPELKNCCKSYFL